MGHICKYKQFFELFLTHSVTNFKVRKSTQDVGMDNVQVVIIELQVDQTEYW